jgi:chromosome partitioning protein
MVHAAKFGVVSSKGGSGKSTSTVHPAIEAARVGFKTLILDCDTNQNSISEWAQALRRDPQPVIRSASFDTIAASIVEAEREGFEYIFIDTPPGSDRFISRVASIVDHILIPVRGTTFDLHALKNTIDMLATTVDLSLPEALRAPNSLAKAAIVLNAVSPRAPGSLFADVDGALAQCGAGGLEIIAVLRERAAYSSALARGVGVTESGRDAEAADEIQRMFKKLRARVRARQAAIEKLPGTKKVGVKSRSPR